jgi:hypothetical protein
MCHLLFYDPHSKWTAAVNEAARVALHPQAFCLATTSTPELAAEWARHPQPPEGHENAQIRTNEAKRNQQAQCEKSNATKHAIAGKQKRNGDDGEQNAPANLRKVEPESKWH